MSPAFCQSKKTALYLEIGATILIALALGAWTLKSVPR
jgi:hypothetical protein